MENIVIVSGASSGLGYELARQLLKKGYSVINIDKDEVRTKQNDKELKNIGNYVSFVGDISDEEFVVDTCNKIFDLGNVVALINNAGEVRFVSPTENCKQILDINSKGLFGMIYLSTQALKRFEITGGKIINIMSSAALKGNPMESVYCAIKWGEKGYTESLKTAYKGTKVKIHGVYPGGINTNFYENAKHYVNDEKKATFMSPGEVAEIIIENIFNNLNLHIADLIIERK